MFVRRRPENSQKLLLWFLFQQPQAFTLVTGLVVQRRFFDSNRDYLFRQPGSSLLDHSPFRRASMDKTRI